LSQTTSLMCFGMAFLPETASLDFRFKPESSKS